MIKCRTISFVSVNRENYKNHLISACDYLMKAKKESERRDYYAAINSLLTLLNISMSLYYFKKTKETITSASELNRKYSNILPRNILKVYELTEKEFFSDLKPFDDYMFNYLYDNCARFLKYL